MPIPAPSNHRKPKWWAIQRHIPPSPYALTQVSSGPIALAAEGRHGGNHAVCAWWTPTRPLFGVSPFARLTGTEAGATGLLHLVVAQASLPVAVAVLTDLTD